MEQKTIRPRSLVGVVVKTAMKDTATVKVDRYVKDAKYKKYLVRSKKYLAHDPGNAEWQRAFQKLRNDLQLSNPRRAANSLGQVQPAMLYEDFGARLEFTRAGWRNPLYAPRPGLERIVWRHDSDDSTLLRETWRALDRARDDEPVSLVALTQVEAVSWRFLDTNREWQTRWPPQSTSPAAAAIAADALPLAVEITLESKDFDTVQWLFRTAARPAPVLAGNCTPLGSSSSGSSSSGGSSGSGSGSSSGSGSGSGSGGSSGGLPPC